jgi:hypothetical protein
MIWYSLSVRVLIWRESDGVAGVDANSVKVFDQTDDNAVVVYIAY